MIELPCLEAVFEQVEPIAAPAELNQEHTVPTAKTKKKQKRKRQHRTLVIDDEPIKKIEIIRS